MKTTQTWLFLTILFLLLTTPLALAEDAIEITPDIIHSYDLPDSLSAAEMLPLPDGGLLLAGSARPEGSNVSAATAVRLDADGRALWTYAPAQASRAYFMSAVPLAEDAFVLLCQIDSKGGEVYATWEITRVQAGEAVASEALVPGNPAVPPQLFPAEDGFYVFYGERTEKDRHGGTFHVPVLEKRDAAGSILWRHVFDQHELYFSASLPTRAGTVFFGRVEEQETGKRNTYGIAVKVSGDGEMLWATESPSTFMKNYAVAAETENGDLLAVGSHAYPLQAKIGVNPQTGVVARFSPEGALLWEKEYDLGVEAVGFGTVESTPFGCVIPAQIMDYRAPLHLLYLDEAGEIQTHFVLASDDEEWDWGRMVLAPSPGTLAITAVQYAWEKRIAGDAQDGATARVRTFEVDMYDE